jgi:PKD repeat protein
LNDTIANRFNLWQPANLLATGTDGSNTLCAAEWDVSRKIACVGDTVTFTDVSYHGAHTRTWNFYGGTTQSLADSVANVVYSTPGFYNVSLQVTDGVNNPSKTETDYIYISPINATTTAINETFQNAAPNFVWEVTGESNGDWNTAPAGYQSSQSFYAPHFQQVKP